MVGIPSEELWLRVFLKLDELKKVRFFMYMNVSLFSFYKYSFQRRIQNNVK